MVLHMRKEELVRKYLNVSMCASNLVPRVFSLSNMAAESENGDEVGVLQCIIWSCYRAAEMSLLVLLLERVLITKINFSSSAISSLGYLGCHLSFCISLAHILKNLIFWTPPSDRYYVGR